MQASLFAEPLGWWVTEQQRDRIGASLRLWAASDSTATPRLTFGHIMAPHTPFLYGQGGRETEPLYCWYQRICSLFEDQAADLWVSEDEYRALFRGHVDVLNQLLTISVSQIVREDPSAIVVLMSDHGVRYTAQPVDGWNRTFLAIRAPQDPSLLSSKPGPDAIFPRLLDSVRRAEPIGVGTRAGD